jgi:signal transduction histidine kinase
MQERDRLAALGQMAAGLAHEIKNPLGAIKGSAQLLSEDHEGVSVDPSSREFIGIILEEVERLDRVVGSVLDYARPSRGNPGVTDVNAVVRRTIQLLASERHDGLVFDVRLADELLPIRADSEQLRQVLINLVRNAVQAMNGRGTVTLTTWQRHGWRPGWSGPSAGTDWVEIAVRDEGPGIQPQVLENLFVPFFTTKIQGTGLGLAISQRLIESMGGRILVASQPGQGSTFSVVMPATTELLTPIPSERVPRLN